MKNWTIEEEEQMRSFLEEVLTRNGVEIDEERFEWIEELNEEENGVENHLYYWIDDYDYDEAYVAYTTNLIVYFDNYNDTQKEWRR